MATSALPTFITALVTRLKSTSSLAGIRIFDGIEIDLSYPGDAIAVGHDGNTEGDDITPASARQEYIQLGAISKFEDGQVTCALWSWDGGTDLSARRTRAYAILGDVEVAIRNDVSFNGIVLYSGLETHEMTYRQTTQGAAVVIQFTVTYRAKI